MANSGHNNSHNSQPGHWSSFTALAGVYPLGFISWLIARTLRGQNSVQKPQPLQRDISINILKDLVALVSVSEDLSGNSVITIIFTCEITAIRISKDFDNYSISSWRGTNQSASERENNYG